MVGQKVSDVNVNKSFVLISGKALRCVAFCSSRRVSLHRETVLLLHGAFQPNPATLFLAAGLSTALQYVIWTYVLSGERMGLTPITP